MVAVKSDIDFERAQQQLDAWFDLGRRLLERGGGRLEIATQAALHAALADETWLAEMSDFDSSEAKRKVFTADEENDVVQWAISNIKEAHIRGGNDALHAIWMLLADDLEAAGGHGLSIDDPTEAGADYLVRFIGECARYVRGLLARATPNELGEIRGVMNIGELRLDEYAPYCNVWQDDDDALEVLDNTMAKIAVARTNKQTADAAAMFAFGMNQYARRVRLTPAYRLGFIGWLARRGLKKPRAAKVQP